MNTNRIFMLTFLTSVTIAGSLLAQTGQTFNVTGTIMDQERKPLANVDVFLAYSQISASTNSDGNFTLQDVPAGTYDVMVMKKGYQMRELLMRVGPKYRNAFVMRLHPDVAAPAVADVPVTDTSARADNIEKFKKAFFSTTSNSYECELVNPEVLEFPESATSFIAVAREPLVFYNQGLGYQVTYILQNFEITINFTKYHGIPKFVELTPKTAEEEQKWRLNRLKAYRGSVAHFIASLRANYATRAKENGALAREGFLVSMVMDLQHEAEEAYRLPTGARAKYRGVDVNDHITPGRNESEIVLSFPNYWDITYVKELEAEEYLWHQGINPNTARTYRRVNPTGVSGDREETYSGSLGNQKSRIKLAKESLTINVANNHYDVLGLTVYDYWSWQGMAEILPREYTLAVARGEAARLRPFLDHQE